MTFKRILAMLGAALVAVQVGSALTVTGNFSLEENFALIPFTVVTTSTVTMFTTSFADGSKGFEPVLTLFNGAGNLLFQDSTGGTAPGGCGARVIDPFTGFCLDAYIQQLLTPDNYTLALSESDNIPGGPTLSNGFPQTGNGNFTGSEFGCGTGGFFLFNCAQRNTDWSVTITGSGLAGAPEPMPMALMSPVLLLPVIVARRRRKQQN
jgi:hypothetical protein